jgi:hypothetical protein
MGWKQWELNLPDLTPALDLSEIIDKIREFLAIIVGILETILNFITAFTDPLAAAIRAIIDKIKETIEGFLEDVGLYVLHVPIRKRLATNFLGLGDITPDWAGELGIFGEGFSDADDPGNQGQIIPPWEDPGVNEFLVNANRYNGGNYGFFKTVIESLWDQGDINRPQFFDPDDYVGGVVMVMGTDFDPLGFLDDIWKLFGMFDMGIDGVPKAPRPKNLKGRAITPIVKTSANTTGGKFSVFLEWDPVEVPITQLTDLGGIILFPERYAVLRSKNNVNALSANAVPDLMGTRTLSTGAQFGPTEVVYEGTYDPMDVTFLEKDLEAEPDDSFYYTIAWKLKGFNQDEEVTEDGGVEYDYWYTSNIVRVVPFPTRPGSTPPDWIRTPSVASIFPQFAYFLRLMVAELEKLAGKLLGGLDLIKEYVEFLKSEIARYEALVNRILDAIEAINAKFQLPTSGVYFRTFKGQGGNTFFIQDLALSLRQSYATSPPFHKGDEYVTGIIIMTGGPELLVDSLMLLLNWLFGGSTDALTPMLEGMDTAVNQLEQQYFETDMSVGEAPAAVELQLDLCSPPPASAPSVTFNPDMSIVSETED